MLSIAGVMVEQPSAACSVGTNSAPARSFTRTAQVALLMGPTSEPRAVALPQRPDRSTLGTLDATPSVRTR